MKLVRSIILIAAICYGAACAYLYFAQRSLLYFPTPEAQHVSAEKISLVSDGETLRIWHVGNAEENAVIYFGGNAEDVSLNIRELTTALPGRAIYLVNYRGYGGSTGVPSEAGFFKDAEDVFDFVRAKHARISVIGRSLGSGVAAYLASVRNVERLVLVTPYDSIEHIAQGQYPIFPVSLLLTDKFTSALRATAIKAPTLIVVAENDSIVPRQNSDALIRAFPARQVTVNVVQGTNHNSISRSVKYLKSLHEFL